MQLAQKLAGYTLSEADLMRRAMGKKKREEMAAAGGEVRQRRGRARDQAGEGREDLLADGAVLRLRFPAATASPTPISPSRLPISRRIIPEHFYAAVLSSEGEDAAKVFKYSKELRAQGIELLPAGRERKLRRIHAVERRDPLRPGGDQGNRLCHVNAIIEARAERAFQIVRLILPSASKKVRSTSECWKDWFAAALLIRWRMKRTINLWRARYRAKSTTRYPVPRG